PVPSRQGNRSERTYALERNALVPGQVQVTMNEHICTRDRRTEAPLVFDRLPTASVERDSNVPSIDDHMICRRRRQQEPRAPVQLRLSALQLGHEFERGEASRLLQDARATTGVRVLSDVARGRCHWALWRFGWRRRGTRCARDGLRGERFRGRAVCRRG